MDGRCKRIRMYAFTDVNGYVWTGPQMLVFDERKFCLWEGEHFPVHLSFFCHGLKGVVKPIRSLTGKQGQKSIWIWRSRDV